MSKPVELIRLTSGLLTQAHLSTEKPFPAQITNPPGQTKLTYRVGTYSTFVKRMLAQIYHSARLADVFEESSRLYTLNLEGDHELGLALLKAWAVVGDVLTFYQERILNEGYLASATEDLSVLELVRTIGHQPRPAMAASTYLAFTLSDKPGSPKELLIPAGPKTVIQSIPKSGELPVTFEPSQAILARPDWNSLSIYKPSQIEYPSLTSESTELRLKGIKTGVRPNSPLLLQDHLQDHTPTNWAFRQIKSVEPNHAQGYTLVSWENLPASASPVSDSKQFEALTFQQQGKLFGHNALPWESVPDSTKQKVGRRKGGAYYAINGQAWRSINSGLPKQSVQALAVSPEGYLFAGTSIGTYRSTDNGQTWHPMSIGLSRRDVQSLFIGPSGQILAGTTGGGVYRSVDLAKTWEPLQGKDFIRKGRFSFKPVSTRLPNSFVLPIMKIPGLVNSTCFVLAGSDSGVFAFVEGSNAWNPRNQGLPSYNPISKISIVSVKALFRNPVTGTFYAATDQGLFCSRSGQQLIQDIIEQLIQVLSRDLGKDIGKSLNQAATKEPDQAPSAASGKSSSGKTPSSTQPSNKTSYKQSNIFKWNPCNRGLPAHLPSRSHSSPLINTEHSDVDPSAPKTAIAVNTIVLSTSHPHGTNYLLIGTAMGVYRSTDDGKHWQPANRGLPMDENHHPIAVRSLVVVPEQSITQSWVLAATGQGIFRSQDHGTTWHPDNIEEQQLSLHDVHVLGANSNGVAIAAAPFDGYVETEWPNFHLQHNCIDLDKRYTHIPARSYVVLSQYLPKRLVEVCQVKSISTVSRKDFSQSATITRLSVDFSDVLPHFDLRQTTVYLQSSSLPLFTPEITSFMPVQGNSIRVVGAMPTLPAGRAVSLTGQRVGARIITPLGGIFELKNSTCKPIGLPNQSIHSLAIDTQGTLIAGTTRGVFGYSDEKWQPLGNSLDEVQALVINTKGTLIAGTAQGVFGYSDKKWQLLGRSLEKVQALVTDAKGTLITGTAQGIFKYANNNWKSLGLVDKNIQALVPSSQGSLYAGTAQGVFSYSGQGTTWKILGKKFLNQNVSSLAIDTEGFLYAGTQGGVYQYDPKVSKWQAKNFGLGNHHVHTLLMTTQNILYVGTKGQGIFYSNNGGDHWLPLSTGISNSVRSLIENKQNEIYAGADAIAVLTSSDGLKRAYLEQPFQFDLPVVYQSSLEQGNITIAIHQWFGRHGHPLSEKAMITSLINHQRWLISDGVDLAYMIDSDNQQLKVYSSTIWEVLTTSGSDKNRRWQLSTPTGFIGGLTATNTDIQYVPAATHFSTKAEVVHIQTATADGTQNFTRLTFNSALENIYDPKSLVLSANVVAATAGETIDYEVLGSGNAAQSNQKFMLRKAPLTFIPSAAAKGMASTLAIQVKSTSYLPTTLSTSGSTPDTGDLWHEVPTFYNSSLTSQHYTTQKNSQGHTTVIFGNGTQGARLPTGNENVIATYRSGGGENSNVAQGQLTLLKKRPMGVRAVTNPVAAEGGIDAESTDHTRQKAPTNIRTLERIVSLNDYKNFVQAFPGIGKILVQRLHGLKTKWIQITIASQEGKPIPSTSTICRDLVGTIHTLQAIPVPIRVDTYDPLYFRLAACVTISANAKADDRKHIQETIHQTLATHYGFAQRNFGQSITSSDIIATLQDIVGVVAIEIIALYLRDSSPHIAQVLPALQARWDPIHNRLRKAQLLLISPNVEDSVTIQFKVL